MHVHEEVLVAANQIASLRDDWTFTPFEVVKALPVLNESSVRTHIVSRCCVNAPRNHLRRWDYFRRVGHGKYEVTSKYRSTRIAEQGKARLRIRNRQPRLDLKGLSSRIQRGERSFTLLFTLVRMRSRLSAWKLQQLLKAARWMKSFVI